MVQRRFRLEQVLTYRCDLEKLRKQDFAQARQAFDHASDNLMRSREHLVGVSREFSHRQTDLISSEELRIYTDFFAFKREEIKRQQTEVEQLGDVLNQRRSDLVDATRDKKVLERLKERHEQEFRDMVSRKEQAFLDELSVQKKEEPDG